MKPNPYHRLIVNHGGYQILQKSVHVCEILRTSSFKYLNAFLERLCTHNNTTLVFQLGDTDAYN